MSTCFFIGQKCQPVFLLVKKCQPVSLFFLAEWVGVSNSLIRFDPPCITHQENRARRVGLLSCCFYFKRLFSLFLFLLI